MNRDSSYDIWIAITAVHTYFDTNKCNLNIEPSKDTEILLRKSGILFRQYDKCTWVLLKASGEDGKRTKLFFEEESYTLQFECKNRESDFYFYTCPEVNISGEGNWKCDNIGKGGVFSRIELPVNKGLTAKKETIQLTLESKTKFWEYILIPKLTLEEADVKLIEDRNKLLFVFTGMVKIPGEQRPAFRFVTDRKIQLKESYDFKISLWKTMAYGEQLLSDNLRCPQPNSGSIFDRQNAITYYHYF